MVSYVVVVGDLPGSRCRACAGWRRGAQCVLDDGDRTTSFGRKAESIPEDQPAASGD